MDFQYWTSKIFTLEGIVVITAVAVGGYMIKEILTPPPPPPVIKEIKPKEMRAVTRTELELCNGQDAETPILIAITGDVYDVSKGREKYGKGGSYNVFAGCDASLCLAKSSLDSKDRNGSIEAISYSEKETLNEWKSFFEMRYEKIGYLETESKL